MATVEHSGLDITPEDVCDRYILYGGIFRHVVAPTVRQKQIKRHLDNRLANLDLSKLQKKPANVDRDGTGTT